MCIQSHHCGAWISLESIGIAAQGCLRAPEWLQHISLPICQSIVNPSIYIDVPHQTLTCTKNASHGAFGFIDVAIMKTLDGSKDLYVKRPIMMGKSLLQEACLQLLVHKRLAEIGFPMGAPKVTHIFRLRDRSICFAMEPVEGAITLDRYLDVTPSHLFSTVIVDCLLQLSAMIWHLDHIGINHRDVKPSNFLIVEHEVPVLKILAVENEIIEISSNYSLTLIDFGFSCIGSTKTQVSNLALSTVYPPSDPCPKEGRDLYLFLGLLYADYYTKMPQPLKHLFESWIDEPGSKMCSFMRKDKEYSKKWLYFMAGNDQIKRFQCNPSRIVADLQALHL
jgi:serine/threonine protein kinase